MRNVILSLLLLSLFSSFAYAQQPTLEWAQRYDAVDSTGDDAVAIAIDAEGYIYVTGTSNSLNPKTTTVKYSPAGDQLWTAQFVQYGGGATAIAVDNQGGVFVTGYGYGDDYDAHYVTVRYDAATGDQVWTQEYNWPDGDFDVPKAIAVDRQGGVFVTGFSSNEGSYDFATVRYDAATGQQTWAQRYDGPARGYDVAWAMAVDNDGGIFVTGASVSTTTDFLTIRYDAATGNEVWTSRYDGPGSGSDGGNAVAVDNQGGVYVTGDSEGHYATLRYDAATGQQVWERRYNETGKGNETPRGIAADKQGGVYVTGYSYGATPFDYVTVRYDAATGEMNWDQRYDGPDRGAGDDFAVALAVDNAGGVYVTGYSGNGTYYPCDDDSCTNHDFATVRYAAATGKQSWVQRYEGLGSSLANNNYAVAIAVDNAGHVYVMGSGNDRSNSYDYVTISYATDTGQEIWTRRYNGTESTDDYTIAVAVDSDGNSYVTGTSSSKATTIKYSPAGQQLWVAQYRGAASAIAVDNKGGVYVTGYSYMNSNSNFTTVRYDAATGAETWLRHYDGPRSTPYFSTREVAKAIVVDGAGGVYVAGFSEIADIEADFVTIRYQAETGEQTWVNHYGSSENFHYDAATAISVDNAGGVYATGYGFGETSTYYVTVRYASDTGKESWVSHYNRAEESLINASAITVDNSGGVYIIGSDGGDYLTLRYEAATGKKTWEQRFDGPSNYYEGSAIAADSSGSVYVTGTSNKHYATIRYEAATGKEMWMQHFDGGSSDEATAIALDNQGGVYVTGTSQIGHQSVFSTVKYAAATGEQRWQVQTEGPDDAAVDLALDRAGNVIITGYSYSPETNYDFLTLKYSQQDQCQDLAEAKISGYTTVSSGLTSTPYSVAAPGATSYNWQITAPDGSAYTSFSGQGTSSIKVNWPDEPEVYKLSVSYAAGESCPPTTSIKYIYVYDTEAGFVTGGGWSESPMNKDYEFMQQQGKAYWAFGAKYKEGKAGDGAGDPVQGALLLVLESGHAFRATSVEEGSLVISGSRAYFTGTGTLTRSGADGLEADPRRFTYLLSAVDGQLGPEKGLDRLRLLIREIKGDGSPGAVVYESQLACMNANPDDNAAACQEIDKGSIVIHRQGIRSLSDRFASAAAEPTAQGLTAYPTAFSDHTTLAFITQQNTDYTLELYDLKGALIRKIAAGKAEAGNLYQHELRAEELIKGLYLVKLSSGEKVQTVKVAVER